MDYIYYENNLWQELNRLVKQPVINLQRFCNIYNKCRLWEKDNFIPLVNRGGTKYVELCQNCQKLCVAKCLHPVLHIHRFGKVEEFRACRPCRHYLKAEAMDNCYQLANSIIHAKNIDSWKENMCSQIIDDCKKYRENPESISYRNIIKRTQIIAF